MNSRIAKTLLPRLSSSGLMVLVIILAFSFVAVVLIPGLELASELADTSIALKFAGQQQRNPALIRASLESMHDRLTNRGYIQESLDPLLKFTGVPYQDNETTGTVLTEGGRQLERDVTTALRVGRHTIPLLDAELAAIVTDLQTRNARSATELRLVMLTGPLI